LPPPRFKFLIYCSLVFGFSFLIISCEKENSITEIEDNSPADVETRSSETVIDILASGTSIGKSINVQVQLSDGSFTQDWTNEISSLGAPILAIIEEPTYEPILPDGTCCEVFLFPPYQNVQNGTFFSAGEKGIDSNDYYQLQFVDFDIDKIEPEQIIDIFDNQTPSASNPNNNSCDRPVGTFGVGWWYPPGTLEPGRYRCTVQKGGIIPNGPEWICDTDIKGYRVNN